MKEKRNFGRWTARAEDFIDVTPIKVRELIIDCFFTSQKETYRRTKEKLGVSSSDDDIYKSVVATVRNTFKEAGENFEEPTKVSLAKVIVLLAKKSRLWGTPREFIAYHLNQIRKAIDLLQ